MGTIVIGAHGVVNAPDLGGHFWVYMQYVQGLLRLGCEVYWLEHFRSTGDRGRDAAIISAFFDRMERYGLNQKVILYTHHADATGNRVEFIGMTPSKAHKVLRSADLLLNFNYTIYPEFLSGFRRTALVDIDPGLLQLWISSGQLRIPRHDLYFTTGETVGTPLARFPDCALPWIRIRPIVCLEAWPYVYDPGCKDFTAVSSWWGNEWVIDGQGTFYENNKRVSFLDFIELPRMTSQRLELALYLDKTPSNATDLTHRIDPDRGTQSDFVPKHPFLTDEEQCNLLESHGWRIRHAPDVAGTPEMYQSYIQGSRGEFGCAKPSCMTLQNAWVSDRTLCYMASGKPVVVQNTGPSAFLPNGEGMFRFSTAEEAVDAFATINASYAHHSRAAREIATTYFDATKTMEAILRAALSAGVRTPGSGPRTRLESVPSE